MIAFRNEGWHALPARWGAKGARGPGLRRPIPKSGDLQRFWRMLARIDRMAAWCRAVRIVEPHIARGANGNARCRWKNGRHNGALQLTGAVGMRLGADFKRNHPMGMRGPLRMPRNKPRLWMGCGDGEEDAKQEPAPERPHPLPVTDAAHAHEPAFPLRPLWAG